MALLDDLETVRHKKSNCGIAEILKTLKADEAIALHKALDEMNASPSNLAAILRKNGYMISRQTIKRHQDRNTNAEGCKCP